MGSHRRPRRTACRRVARPVPHPVAIAGVRELMLVVETSSCLVRDARGGTDRNIVLLSF
jgi:hypothetical protein